MVALYNEIDPYAADWLGNLVAAGHIAPGVVERRSIVDLRPADVAGYRQAHFFAGVAGWSLALRLAGWPDDRPVWTGSCPCQPFSAAGQRKGFSDERHLWPAWFRLIRECRPAIVFGEQVDRAFRHGWLDAVFADLEAEGYACGAIVLGAHSVGAPHIRQRLWFVADAHGQRQQKQHALLRARRQDQDRLEASGRSPGARQWRSAMRQAGSDRVERSVEPGIFPLAHGLPAGLEQCRAYGNAIVPQVAAAFISACMDSLSIPAIPSVETEARV